MILKDVVTGKFKRKENTAWQVIPKISLFTEKMFYFISVQSLAVCFNEAFESHNSNWSFCQFKSK